MVWASGSSAKAACTTAPGSSGPETQQFFIDVKKHTGRAMMACGQTAITEDPYTARDAAGGLIVEQAEDVELQDIDI